MVLFIGSWLVPSLHRELKPSLLILLIVIIVDINVDGVFRNISLSEIEIWQNIPWDLQGLIGRGKLLIYLCLHCSPWINVSFAVIIPLDSAFIIIVPKIPYLKGIELFAFSLANLHLEYQIDYLLNIGPLVRFDLGKDEHLIDIHLESTQSWEEGLFLFPKIVVFCIFGIRPDFLEVLRRLHLYNCDVVSKSHALQCCFSDLLEVRKVFIFIVEGTPGVLVAVQAKLHLHQELHNINFIGSSSALLLYLHPQSSPIAQQGIKSRASWKEQLLCYKRNIINIMTYLLLPSARLALYEATAKKILVTPLKGEELVSLGSGQQERVVVTYQKSLSIFNGLQLRKGDIHPAATASFNKKLQGLSHNQADTIFVSDKFGDIYSVSLEAKTKYLNSNLGIPTFLQRLAIGGKGYIAVGDEQTRIKIYNQARMHEIISFWFLARRVPLQLLPASQNTLLLLLKRQQANFNSEEQQEGAVEVHQLSNNNIESQQFSGELLLVSPEIEGKEECKYQTLVGDGQGNAYLVKLFASRVKVVELALAEDKYKLGWERNVVITEGEWDSLYAVVSKEGADRELAITYGKAEELQLQTTTQPYEKELLSFQDGWKCSVNNSEHLIVLKV